MIQIKYVKEMRGHKVGDVVNISRDGGDSAVAAGVAEYVKEVKAIPIVAIIPERIKSFNFTPILDVDGKNPNHKGWQNKEFRFDNAGLLKHLESGKNYGIRGGGTSPVIIDGKSHFLIVVDFDTKEFQDKVLSLFPETFTTTSGSPKNCFHLWFASDSDVSFKIHGEGADGKLITLADVIGEGGQIIGPGSKHKSGSVYHIVKDIPLVFIPYSEIEAILKPYDKKPKKEKTFKKEFLKEVSNDVTDKILGAISMKQVLEELNIDTSKNPTNCPFHTSERGKCMGWNEETAHCFNCKDSWNKYSFIREGKKLTSKETFDWFAEKAGMLTELKSSRKKFAKKKEISSLIPKAGEDVNDEKFNLIKPEIGIPQKDMLISEFADKITKVLALNKAMFYRNDLKEPVEIIKFTKKKLSEEEPKDEESNNKESVTEGFSRIKPNRFITLIEEYLTPGIYLPALENGKVIVNEDGSPVFEFSKKSINSDLANTTLQSSAMQKGLPIIEKIFTAPFPVIYQGELTTPTQGYDPRFNSWLVNDSPQLTNPPMSVKEARTLLTDIYKEFCFQTKQDFTNAIAGLITPFLRCLYKNPTARAPIFFYMANRERAGKDYCAGITGITLEGYASEEPPISNSENSKTNNTEELRKKILAGFISGRIRFHFSNNKGYINNAVFESVTTAQKYSDRILGRNENLSFDNFLEFSLSGNVGVSFTPDLANRCRFIRLFLAEEDANARKFVHSDLHGWLKSNRGLIISAIHSLVRNWVNGGMKPGTVSFASYPEWASICGGIMEAAGFDSPCIPDEETLSLSGDVETADMKELFELCYKEQPDIYITQKEIKEIILKRGTHLFPHLDFDKKSDVVKFGIRLKKFIGRYLSDICLKVDDIRNRGARQRFLFTKQRKVDKNLNLFGYVGELGDVISSHFSDEGKIYDIVESRGKHTQHRQHSQTDKANPFSLDTDKLDEALK